MGEKSPEEQKSVFYTPIPQKREVRKAVLESTKVSIQFLKRFEQLKALRQQKATAYTGLKEVITEISSQLSRCKAMLPKQQIKDLPVIEGSVASPNKEATEKKNQSEAKKKASELEALEASLSEIEAKLGNLN
ncbi:hypothetical protein HYW21_04005 [Candidatus Woesearchaeota archaeon]|nr:hypothetical protein [Candidatus Woesearchaeota archaeon]